MSERRSDPQHPNGRAALRAIAWLLILLPALVHLTLLPKYGRVQRDDYWGAARWLVAEDGSAVTPWSDPARIAETRVNVHRAVLPALLWSANISWFGGDNRPTALFGLLCLGGIFLVLLRAKPAVGEPFELLTAAVLSAWVFAPAASYNLAKSFGAVHYYLADLLALSALWCLCRPGLCRDRQGARGLWPVLALGLLGAATFPSNLALWPALFVGALLLRRPWPWSTAIVAAAACAAVFHVGWPWALRGAANGSASIPEILHLLLIFVGALYDDVTRGTGFGAAKVGLCLGLGALTVVVLVVRKLGLWTARGASKGQASEQAGRQVDEKADDRRKAVFWITVLVYVGASGLLVGYGRAAVFGPVGGLAVRYALFPQLFLAATFMLALLLSTPQGRRRPGPRQRGRAAVWVALGTALLAVPVYLTDQVIVGTMVTAGRRQAAAEVGLRLRAWVEPVADDPLLGTVSRAPEQPVDLVSRLAACEHVPFDRPAPELWGPAVDPAAPDVEADPDTGLWTGLRTTRRADVLLADGYLELAPRRLRGPDAPELVFVARGRAGSRQVGAVVLHPYHHERTRTHWSAYLPRPDEAGSGDEGAFDTLEAWVRFDDGSMRPLAVDGKVVRALARIASPGD